MANKFSLSLVLGGAVAASVGNAFRTVEGGIDKLAKKGEKAKVLKSTIGETMKLQTEWKRAHDTGAATADKLQRKLNTNLEALRKQGVEVGRLGREYSRLGREAKAADLQVKGRTQIGEGAKGLKSNAGQAVAFSAALAIPTKVSGDYQARIRQMALWAHIAGDGEEKQLADKIAQVAADAGMGQQALAAAVGGLIEKGIDWQESVDYAPLIADLLDGQGMEAETIATLFSAFKEAGVKKEDMGAMLGQVAAAGDIGAFGPKDMARYMPSLLGTIKTLGMEGPEAVRFLGASLQSQYKQTQDSAAAATNMNNLLAAVISSTSQERFAKQGIDLAGSIAQATKSGKADNPVEAFIKLTDVLLKQQNPTKFKEVQALKKKIQESAEGSAEEAQAMASLLESAGLATIVSDQSASAGLLAQIKYGNTIKEDMATIKATDGKVKIEQDAAKARETSNAKWATATAAAEASMTRLGDAIRPLTDRAADALATVTYAIADLTNEAPNVVAAIVGIGAALIGAKALFNGFKVVRGVTNLARGSLMGNPNAIQRVFVTNARAGGVGISGEDRGRRRRSRRVARGRSVGRRLGGAISRFGRGAMGKAAALGVGATALAAPVLAQAGQAGQVGQVGKAFGMARLAAKRLPGMDLLASGMAVADTAMNAETRDEKAEGYGSAAGGLAGALAGGAAGAALGSVVPVIGTAIGGAIGAALGSMGGESLGGWLGLKLFGEDKPQAVAKAPGEVVRDLVATAPPAPSAAQVASAATPPKPPAPKVDQAFSFAPSVSLVVQGDVKDPAQVVRSAETTLRGMWEGWQRDAGARMSSGQLYDAADVA